MSKENKTISKWDRIMMAITFAEAGEAETAREIMSDDGKKLARQEKVSRKEIGKRPEMRL